MNSHAKARQERAERRATAEAIKHPGEVAMRQASAEVQRAAAKSAPAPAMPDTRKTDRAARALRRAEAEAKQHAEAGTVQAVSSEKFRALYQARPYGGPRKPSE